MMKTVKLTILLTLLIPFKLSGEQEVKLYAGSPGPDDLIKETRITEVAHFNFNKSVRLRFRKGENFLWVDKDRTGKECLIVRWGNKTFKINSVTFHNGIEKVYWQSHSTFAVVTRKIDLKGHGVSEWELSFQVRNEKLELITLH